jgi:hypothetical protein
MRTERMRRAFGFMVGTGRRRAVRAR